MKELYLEGGKYIFQETKEGSLVCLRHGEYWRVFIGDKVVHALFDQVIEDNIKLERANKEIAFLREAIRISQEISDKVPFYFDWFRG